MKAGTIVESAAGTETAARLVYYARWFQALLAALAINVLAWLRGVPALAPLLIEFELGS
jgi:hypothetical protein